MFESPDAIVAQLYLKNGDVVVDMGAGMGAFSVAAGKKVGKEGVVYAVEVQRQLLNIIAENAKHANVGNVRVIWGDVERDRGTKLASGIANVVIIANVLFQVEEKHACSRGRPFVRQGWSDNGCRMERNSHRCRAKGKPTGNDCFVRQCYGQGRAKKK